MSIEVLKKFAEESGNEEVLSAVSSVEQSFKSNVEKLSYLEKEKQTAIEKRDSVRGLVKSKFGIDEITEEALDGFLSSVKDGSGNDKEISNLTSMVEMLKVEKEGISKKYQDTINSYKIEKQLNSLGAIEETENQRAYDIVLKEVISGAEFNADGELVFKANDGTTIRNSDGSPMSLEDRYNQVKDSDDLSFLFKNKRTKTGASAKGGKFTSKVTSLDGLDEQQRIALFRQDPELYRKLAGNS